MFAGAFRIQIKDRLGYILIDLGLGTHEPIVLMENREDPAINGKFEY